MILTNTDILACMRLGHFGIEPLAGGDPSRVLFNTSSVDLRLADQIAGE